MNYSNNETESLKREVASLERNLHYARRELASLGALIRETVAWGKEAIGNPSFHDRNFETVMLYRALDHIERNADNAVRRGGCSQMGAEHFKGEATSAEELVKWLGWDTENSKQVQIKLDADATYPVERVVELLESINTKLGHIDFRTSMK